MAQTGGTSGGCLPASFLDLPMDYDTLAQNGAALGSGALLIMDDTHCIVDVLKCFQKFFAHESCGRCTPCREGTARLVRDDGSDQRRPGDPGGSGGHGGARAGHVGGALCAALDRRRRSRC